MKELEGVVCLIDDILVFGCYQAEHDDRLHTVLQRLLGAGITLNNKCVLSVLELKFICNIVGKNEVRPDPNKVSAVIDIIKAETLFGLGTLFFGNDQSTSKICASAS